jgi:hypothetical protein
MKKKKIFSPFRFSLGDSVYTVNLMLGVLSSTHSIVIRRYRTSIGNVYTTTTEANVMECCLLGRDECVASMLAGKMLEMP